MADITETEIREAVEQALPVGTGDKQITSEHIHKIQRAPSTRDVASSELDAVVIEFKHETNEPGNEVTFKVQNAEPINDLKHAIKTNIPDEYDLIDRNQRNPTRPRQNQPPQYQLPRTHPRDA